MSKDDALRDQGLYDQIGQIAADYGALHRQAVRDLARARDDLARTRAALGTVAHDLRAPLAAVLGFTELLLADEDLTTGQRELGDRVDRAARTMNNLTDELVEAVTAGASPLRLEQVDLCPLARHVIARHQLLQPVRGVRVVLVTEPGDDDPAIVHGDEAKLERVLENLVSNAVKFSPDGGEVRVRVTGDADVVEVRVSDDGPGLPPAQHESVFDPFHRAPEAASVPGVGLGLTIVKQVTERHGGRAHVESVLGAGATFVIRLPRSRDGRHPS